jgi:hypothetical protein
MVPNTSKFTLAKKKTIMHKGDGHNNNNEDDNHDRYHHHFGDDHHHTLKL